LQPKNNAVIAGVLLGNGDWTKYFGLPESF
jgi:hypothetical protein